MKCIINIFELKNKIENINAGELKKYTKEQLNEKNEILVKSFKLNVVNFDLSGVYNHKERAIAPDCYVRSVRFKIERSDEFRDYVNSKPDNYRLLFLIDEVGQYVGGDTDLLINLQSLVEKIGSECGGKIWVVCTGQEAIDEIIKYDFTNIYRKVRKGKGKGNEN